MYTYAPTLSTLPTSSHSVNHPSPLISLELNNAPPPNSVLVYVWEVRPGSLKWRGLNAPRQSGYVPGMVHMLLFGKCGLVALSGEGLMRPGSRAMYLGWFYTLLVLFGKCGLVALA